MKTRLLFISMAIAFIALFQMPLHLSRRATAQIPAVATTAKLVTGLTLSFQNSAGQTVDARAARLVALRVPANTSASPMLPPGKFIAVFTGLLTTKIKDTYRFAAEGRGDLIVTLNNKPLLELHGDLANHPTEPVLLHKGRTKLVVTYSSPADGDATVRLLWAASGKTLEPIPPTVFLHEAADEALAAHQAAREGREIVASMRCIACHQGITGNMPEFKQDAPNLIDLKTRLNTTWVASWISNPRALRPTANMPRVFHDGSDVDSRAGDIAAYLTTSDTPVTPVSDPVILARGARLFTGLGCVGCHVAPDVTDSDPTLNRVALKYVRAKFKPEALVEFLSKPEAHYAWTRMPNFHLAKDEATSLASWLIARCAPDALSPSPISKTFNADNGKLLFETSGCLNCHAIGSTPPRAPTATHFKIADFSRGCAADDEPHIGKGVDYSLTASQRQSIRAFIAVDWKSSLANDPLPEFSDRQMTALRCNACHSIDGHDNAWSNLDTEIGSIEQDLPPRPDNDPEPKGDQSRPPLTWTGEKLRPDWMTAFIAGEIGYKPRPWIFARMPAFASRAGLLAKGMALTHGCWPDDEPQPAADANMALIGKTLTGQTRFGCVKCHSVGEQAALAPFEAEAPNLAHVEARLRHEYFSHWMRNPQYYLPGTKMPSFANVDGQTPYREILGGDATAEYEAIWSYLRAGEKIVPSQDEELPAGVLKTNAGP